MHVVGMLLKVNCGMEAVSVNYPGFGIHIVSECYQFVVHFAGQ